MERSSYFIAYIVCFIVGIGEMSNVASACAQTVRCGQDYIAKPNKPPALLNLKELESEVDRKVKIPKQLRSQQWRVDFKLQVDCNGRLSFLTDVISPGSGEKILSQLKIDIIKFAKCSPGYQDGVAVNSYLTMAFHYSDQHWKIVWPRKSFTITDPVKEKKIRILLSLNDADTAIMLKQWNVVNVLIGNNEGYDTAFWRKFLVEVKSIDYLAPLAIVYDSIFAEQDIEILIMFHKLSAWNQYQKVALNVPEYEMDEDWFRANFSHAQIAETKSFFGTATGKQFRQQLPFLEKKLDELVRVAREDMLITFRRHRIAYKKDIAK